MLKRSWKLWRLCSAMLGRCAILALAAALFLEAQTQVKQGEVLRITSEGSSAQLNDKTIRLFPQSGAQNLGLMPIPVTQKLGKYVVLVKDAHGAKLKEIPIEVVDAHYPRQNIRASKAMKSLTPLPGEMDAVRALNNTVSEKRMWMEPFVSQTSECMNSLFGVMRYHNGVATGNFHRGVDLRSPAGRPVHAISPGVVKISQMFRLHGGMIGIDHGQGVISTYLHMSKLAVPEGTVVKAGDVVGYVGATGFATGPHLHWGLYVNGVPVNPSQWIPDVPRCQ
jgi:murein DD-endopeptidase MepM/ murein hydrolase activator NlpD